MVGASMRAVLCVCAVMAGGAAALRGGDVDVAAVPPAAAEASSFVEVAATTGAAQGAGRNLGVRGDMTVQGTLSANTLTSPIGDVKVSGSVDVTGRIEAAKARGSFLSVKSSTSVTSGIVPKGDQLMILGKIDTDTIKAESFETSFLEVGGVRQWQLVSVEDFEEEGADAASLAEGWNHKDVSECAGNKFLGGPCTKGGSTELKKVYSGLPAHSQVRITSKYLFIDSWDGEHAYLNVDGRAAWADTYNHASVTKGLNVCGNDTPEGRLMSHIDVTIPHTADSVELTFGATTDEHACDESFGVDSVMVFVR